MCDEDYARESILGCKYEKHSPVLVVRGKYIGNCPSLQIALGSNGHVMAD